MTNEERKDILKRIIATWGENAQLRMCIEEMSELTKAICKYWRVATFGEGDDKEMIKNIQEEVADVIICAEQVKMMFGEDEVEKIIDYKLKRSEGYLPKEEK